MRTQRTYSGWIENYVVINRELWKIEVLWNRLNGWVSLKTRNLVQPVFIVPKDWTNLYL